MSINVEYSQIEGREDGYSLVYKNNDKTMASKEIYTKLHGTNVKVILVKGSAWTEDQYKPYNWIVISAFPVFN